KAPRFAAAKNSSAVIIALIPRTSPTRKAVNTKGSDAGNITRVTSRLFSAPKDRPAASSAGSTFRAPAVTFTKISKKDIRKTSATRAWKNNPNQSTKNGTNATGG